MTEVQKALLDLSLGDCKRIRGKLVTSFGARGWAISMGDGALADSVTIVPTLAQAAAELEGKAVTDVC